MNKAEKWDDTTEVQPRRNFRLVSEPIRQPDGSYRALAEIDGQTTIVEISTRPVSNNGVLL